MKKLISMILVVVMTMACFVACGSSNSGANSTISDEITPATVGDKGISVVTTIFPEYDWVKEIVGENEDVDITMLLDNGVDLHSYQPTADDLIKVSEADLFIYVGGESDGWVEDALAEAVNTDMVVINLLDVLGDSVKEEEVVEGMEAEEEEDESKDESAETADNTEPAQTGEDDGDEEIEYDEHVWLSLRNSEILVNAIAEALCSIDEDNADSYRANSKAYVEKLDELDKKYEEVVENAATKTVLFGDRFPFRYLVDDYGLDYYAAFVGCSAETEASFETILFLANKVDELGLSSVLQIETADGTIANTIVENTTEKNAKVLTLDSMQSTTSEDVNAGATYYSIMENNLEVLEEALGQK